MASREHEIHIDADCDATRTLLIIGNGFDDRVENVGVRVTP